jgi:hypothetical protein
VIWVSLACAVIVGLIAGFLLGAREAVSSMQSALRQLNHELATDREFLFRVLRRELANWMLRRDPDRYLRIYKGAREAAEAISVAGPREQRAQLTKLTEKYPYYVDFDLVNAREHILYADALSLSDYDEVERHFTDIVRFQALQISLDDNWCRFRATSYKDLVHLEQYVQQFKDTRFAKRLKDAVHDFNIYRRAKNEGRGAVYENATFSVRPVAHFAESRSGFHFEDTDEFGLHTIFVDDNGKSYENYYRSDATFDQTIFLNNLRIDEPV